MNQWTRIRPAATGLEAARREALITAAIAAIEEAGSMEATTMAQIAARASVSPALVHHYFGAKDDLMIAAMRHLLFGFRNGLTRRLAAAGTPRERVSAVIAGCFDPSQFSREAIAAWLVFYLYARRSGEAARLLRLYFRRLETNLISGLAPLLGPEAAISVAAAAGAMIDGVWLRQALTPLTAPDGPAAARMVERYIDAEIGT